MFVSGVHEKAMSSFPSTASEGKTFGYETETLPTFKQALEVWRANAAKY
jgi:hypothetical protein